MTARDQMQCLYSAAAGRAQRADVSRELRVLAGLRRVAHWRRAIAAAGGPAGPALTAAAAAAAGGGGRAPAEGSMRWVVEEGLRARQHLARQRWLAEQAAAGGRGGAAAARRIMSASPTDPREPPFLAPPAAAGENREKDPARDAALSVRSLSPPLPPSISLSLSLSL
jgi:hypothetical protein